MTEERPLALLAFVAVGAVLLSCAGVYVATNRWNSSDVNAAAFTRGSGGGEAETLRVLQEEVQREAAAREEASRTLAKARAGELLAKASETHRTLEDAGAAFATWDELVSGLLSSDVGKRLASNPRRVADFQAVYRRLGRPSRDGLSVIEARASALEENLRKVEKSDEPTLPPGVAKQYEEQLGEDQQAAQMVLRALQDDIGAVESIVAEAEGAEAASTTLDEAVRALEAERLRERAAAIARVREEVAAEQLARDKEMEREKYTQIRVAERQGREAQLEDERLDKETAAALREQKSKEDALRARAESGAVQAKYAPFLTLGDMVPHSDGGPGMMDWKPGHFAIGKPVSYSTLKRIGATENFEWFVKLVTNGKNDRGAWPAPADQDDLDDYRAKFAEFNKLAELWVQMDKLGK